MKKYNLHIGIDVDGTLRDFRFQFIKYAREVRGIDIDPMDTNTWGFPNVRDNSGRKVIVDVFANPAVGQYVYEQAPTIENAFTGFRMFVENPRINVYIVSSQKKGYEQFTDNWLEKNGFSNGIQGVFYESKKTNAPVQILIDDKPEHIIAFNQNKRDSILIDQPYNRTEDIPDTVPRVTDMIDAYKYVTKRYSKYL